MLRNFLGLLAVCVLVGCGNEPGPPPAASDSNVTGAASDSPEAGDGEEAGVVLLRGALTLGRIGPYAQEHGPRIRGVMIAGMIGGFGTPRAVAALAGVSTGMARTFSRTLLDPKDSTEELVLALQDQNPFVRAFAAELLFTRGEGYEFVIAGLHKAVREPHPKEVLCEEPGWNRVSTDIDLDRRIHRLAARALVQLAPEDPRCIDGHRILLNQIDPELRRNAVMALGHLGSAAAPAVPQILDLLQSDNLAIQREIVTTLGMIGPEARSAIPLLEQLTENQDRQLAERARVALGRIR